MTKNLGLDPAINEIGRARQARAHPAKIIFVHSQSLKLEIPPNIRFHTTLELFIALLQFNLQGLTYATRGSLQLTHEVGLMDSADSNSHVSY